MSAGPISEDELKHSGIETDISLEQLIDILKFCEIPRSRAEIQERCGYKSATYFKNKILNPLIIGGQLVLTIPGTPKHPKQKVYEVSETNQKMKEETVKVDHINEHKNCISENKFHRQIWYDVLESDKQRI